MPSRLEGERVPAFVQALPLVLVLVIASFMVERDGGFAITIWSPVAILVVGLVALVTFSVGPSFLTFSRAKITAAACLAAFTIWSYCTIAWAAVRGDAWNGSNRTVLYLAVFSLLAFWQVRARAIWPALLGAGVVIAGEGVYTVERAIHASDPNQYIIGSRLSEPLGYPNATAALYMTIALLMFGLASRPWLPAPARGLALGLAGLCGVLNILGESRGSLFTLPIVVVVYFVLVPGRLRSTAMLGLLALALLPLARPVAHVYGGDADRIQQELRHAINLTFVACAALVAAGWLFAVADNHIHVSPRVARIAGAATVTAVALALVGATIALRPWTHAEPAWHSFRHQLAPSSTATHFGSLGSNRYDFWRVGLIEFKRHPIQGIGADNFLVPYLQQRRSGEEPIYPHSLAIDLLSQTGIVGAALFLGFLAAVAVAAVRIPKGYERELAGVCLAGGSVWLVHGTVDWLWEMPVLSVLGMALLGTASGLAPGQPMVLVATWSRARHAAAVTGAAAIALVAVASVSLPWLSERFVQRAVGALPGNPQTAFDLLDRARTLDPLSNRADVLAGALAGRLHRYDLMRRHYQNAVERSPDDWYANLELGIAASLTGHRVLAQSALDRAARLNPGEPIVRRVVETFRSGHRIDSDAVDRAIQHEAT
jgi:O-antigen ligase/polysaccharide polymerase Wzy-like membrane protein